MVAVFIVVPWLIAALILICIVFRRKAQSRRPYHEYLHAPASYWAAPPEVKETLCNGAGPDCIGWLVPDTIYGLRITEAANIHDWMYVWGDTERDKDDADATFLVNLMRIINQETTTCPVIGWAMRYLRHRRALKYYEAVHDLGGGAFIGARTARPPEYVAGIPLAGGAPCTLPPPGWLCTRVAGHTGPCAAVPDVTDKNGSWPEDFNHENGNYQCRCQCCMRFFYGHKRRVVCRRCYDRHEVPDGETT